MVRCLQAISAPFEKHGIPDFYELVLIAGEDFLKSRPQLAKGFVNALQKGIEKTLEQPEQAMEIFFKIHPDLRDELHRKSFTTTLPYFKGSPGQTTERWKNLHDFMLERKLIEKPVPVGEMFENLAENR